MSCIQDPLGARRGKENEGILDAQKFVVESESLVKGQGFGGGEET